MSRPDEEAPAAPSQTRAVLFDLDGTLLDTADDISDALNRLRHEHGRPPLNPAEANRWVSHGALAMTRLGFPEATGAEFEALRQRLLEIYHAALAVKTRPYAGVPEALERLNSAGIPWGIVTNKVGWLTRPLLLHFPWAARAGVVLSGDTLARRKPHPDQLLHAAQVLGTAPANCLYIGDARGDVLAARAAGMPVYVALFGYLPPGEHPREWPADGWLPTPAAMARLLASVPARPPPRSAVSESLRRDPLD